MKIHEAMKLILGGKWSDHPFGHLKRKDAELIVDKINKRLRGTDCFFMICADAMAVSNTKSAKKFAKATFKKDMFK